MRSILLLALALATATTASAHGLVAVGTGETEADLVAISVFGNATGMIAITLVGDAHGDTLGMSACGHEPCTGATLVGPSSDGLLFLSLGAPYAPSAIAVSDRDASAEEIAISLFGDATCESGCSTTVADEPVALVAVSGTGCARGAVAISASDCGYGFLVVNRNGLDDGHGYELVLATVASILP